MSKQDLFVVDGYRGFIGGHLDKKLRQAIICIADWVKGNANDVRELARNAVLMI
jgi:hypothetical protein